MKKQIRDFFNQEAKNMDFPEVFMDKLTAITLDYKNEDQRIKTRGREGIRRGAYS